MRAALRLPHRTRDASTGARVYTLERDGLAHFGLLPDFVENAIKVEQELAGTSNVSATLFDSADATIAAWELALTAAVAVANGTVSGAPVVTGMCRPGEVAVKP